MSVRAYETLARRAADELSRRASLVALAMAGVATLVSPVVDAKHKKKKKPNMSDKKTTKACKKELAECSAQERQCRRQVDECIPVVTAACGGGPRCQRVIACCQFLRNCNVTAFLDCVDTSDR